MDLSSRHSRAATARAYMAAAAHSAGVPGRHLAGWSGATYSWGPPRGWAAPLVRPPSYHRSFSAACARCKE